MSTPQTLPSKAVLRALQGLLLGTSCSLAVLIEDRRRRINAVQAVLENGRKLRAIPQYHEGGAERAIARALNSCNLKAPVADSLRDGLVAPSSLFQGALNSRNKQNGPTSSGPTPLVPISSSSPSPNPSPSSSPTSASDDAPVSYFIPVYAPRPMTLARYYPGMDRLVDRRQRYPRSQALRGQEGRLSQVEDASQEMIRIITTITSMLSTPSQSQWDQGWNIALRAISRSDTRPILETALLDNVLDLCRALEDAGRVREVGQLLMIVTRWDPSISQSEPNLVERTLFKYIEALCSSDILPGVTQEQAMDRAVSFYMAAFSKQPPSDIASAVSLCLRIVPLVVELGLYRVANRLVSACGDSHPRIWDLRDALLAALVKREAHLQATNYFLEHYSVYPDTRSAEQATQIVDWAVGSVVALEGLKSGAILDLVIDNPQTFRVSIRQRSRLLDCHWMHTKDFGATEKYYEGLLRLDVGGDRINMLRRTMMGIAFTAGESGAGEAIREELEEARQTVPGKVLTLGTVALEKTRRGDVDQVKTLFSTMMEEASSYTGSGHPLRSVSRAIPPVLKEFAKTHTLEEVNGFVHYLIMNLGIPLDKYVVTFMAKRFAMQHESDGLADWLNFCASTGFVLDTIFLHALLSSCRRYGFTWTRLSSVARKMTKLNPEFDQREYGNIIRDSATKCESGNPVALHLAMDQIILQNEKGICRAMLAAIRRGEPKTALKIYGDIEMPEEVDRSGNCLRQAILASVIDEGGGSVATLDLIREAQGKGQDVGPAMAPLLVAHLEMLSPLVDPVDEFLRLVRDLREKDGIRLSGEVFRKAADRCVRIGREGEALHFLGTASMMEAVLEGSKASKEYFAIKMRAYALLGQDGDLQLLLAEFTRGPLRTDVYCLRRLREVKNVLARRNREVEGLNRGMQLIGQAVDLVRRERRRRVGTVREKVVDTALAIVAEAARKAVRKKGNGRRVGVEVKKDVSDGVDGLLGGAGTGTRPTEPLTGDDTMVEKEKGVLKAAISIPTREVLDGGIRVGGARSKTINAKLAVVPNGSQGIVPVPLSTEGHDEVVKQLAASA